MQKSTTSFTISKQYYHISPNWKIQLNFTKLTQKMYNLADPPEASLVEKSWVFHNFPEAPLPPLPRGRGLAAEEETASALLPRSFAFLKKEMKFLLTERLRSSSSSAGKNGKASRFSGEAVSPCLEAAASLSSARFRLYNILFPAGQKVKLQTQLSIFNRS
jgi:hypothetical protein